MNTAYGIASALRKSIKPTEDPNYLRFLRSQCCCVCGSFRGVQAAHFGPRGLSQKADVYQGLPLCWKDHQVGPNSYHKLGPVKFAGSHHLDVEALIEQHRALYIQSGNHPKEPISRVRLKPADLMEEVQKTENPILTAHRRPAKESI